MSVTLTLDREVASTPMGMDTMSSAFPEAHRYHQWVYDSFSDLLQGRILEVGMGSGIHTRMLLRHGPVVATDLDERCLERVRREHSGAALECYQLNLENTDDFAPLRESPCDSSVCLHVLEHVRDDELALRNLHSALRPGGRLILYVPAMPSIFGTMDEMAGHYRRYQRGSLHAKLNRAGFDVIRSQYQNSLCVPGWWLNGRVLKRRDLSEEGLARQIRFFDRYLVPPAKCLDYLTRRLFGQSLFVGAERRA